MNGTTVVLAPVRGRTVAMADVPDPIFAEEMVGPGAAIDPPHAVVDAIAPVAGRLLKVHPHAYVILSDDGVGVLVHLGIDTVELGGAGFRVRVEPSARVAAGDVVVTYDVPAIVAAGRHPVVPVVLLEQESSAVSLAEGLAPGVDVGAGDAFLTLSRRVGGGSVSSGSE